jgi:hypothetical protein
MNNAPLPMRIPNPNPYYQGRIDPFFTALDALISKNETAVNRVFTEQKANPRAVGVMATVLLHPKIDMDYVERVSEKYGLQNEFGYLARTALQLVDDGPSSEHFQKEFAAFQKQFEPTRKPALEKLARAEGQSSISRFTLREFRKHYEVYGHFVYNGATTLPFSKRT